MFFLLGGALLVQGQKDGTSSRDRDVVNFGVYFKHVGDAHIVTRYWSNSFLVQLPTVKKMKIWIPTVRCTGNISDPVADRLTKTGCFQHEDLNYLMNYMYEQFEFERMRIINTIYKMFPCRMTVPVGRQSRSPFGFVGTGLSYLFGVASHDDLVETANHVRSVLQTQNSGTVELQHQIDALRSLASIANVRLNRTSDQLDRIQRALVGFSVDSNRAIEAVSQYVRLMIRKLIDATLVNDHLRAFLNGLELLSLGILSPEVVGVDQLKQSLENVAQVLKSKYANFELLAKTPEYFYSRAAKIIGMRFNETLAINVKYPITSSNKPVGVYQIIRIRVPVSQNQPHGTEIEDLPNFIVVSKNNKFFIPFEAEPNIDHGLIKIGDRALINMTDTCVAALFVNDPSAIHSRCRANFVVTPGVPLAVRLSGTTVLLGNVRKYTVFCANGSTVHDTHCTYCQVTIACDCSLMAENLILPAQLKNCDNPVLSMRQELVNLKILFNFFDSEKLASLDGATKFDRLVNVSLPSFQVSKEDMRFETDLKVNLEGLTKKIKQNRKIFYSQQAELRDKLDNMEFSAKFDMTSWRDLTLAIGLVVTGLLTGLTIYLLCRLSTISAALALIPVANAWPILLPDEQISHFVYRKQTTDDVETPDSGPFRLNIDLAYHSSYLQVLLSLAILANLLAILMCRVRRRARPTGYGCQICINFFDEQNSVLVFGQRIGESSDKIQFGCTEFIRNVQLLGCWKPEILIQWGLQITHVTSKKPIKFQTVISLGFREGLTLKRILRGGNYFAIPLIRDATGDIVEMTFGKRPKLGTSVVAPVLELRDSGALEEMAHKGTRLLGE